MMKRWFFLLAFLVMAKFAPAAQEPFDMRVSYNEKSATVRIHLTRLQEDELRNFMQKIVIFKNSTAQVEENMINQNHLQDLTKEIHLAANVNDVIKVVLYYGQDQTLAKEIKVTDSSAKEKAEPQASNQKSQSILVSDEQISETETPKSESSESGVLSSSSRTVSPQPDQGYGYKDLGYKPSKEQYGYSVDQNPDVHKAKDVSAKYGYQLKRESYGKETIDDGIKSEVGYSYKNFGDKPDDDSYGR